MSEYKKHTGCKKYENEEFKYDDALETIPYVAFEAIQERNNRNFKRMIIAFILSVIIVVFASNFIWLCVYTGCCDTQVCDNTVATNNISDNIKVNEKAS